MKLLRLIAAAAFVFIASFGAAKAQTPVYCYPGTGSLTTATPCQASNPLAVSATITPSGTQNVNLTQILSAAPSLTNPLWVTPATGASFAVTGTFFQATQPVSIAATVATSSASSATGGASYAYIAAGQATTAVKASAGTLYSICFNSAASATNVTTVYDNPSTSGTVIAIPNAVAATVPTCLQYGPAGIAFANGLTIITTTANGANMTVSYK